MLEHITASKTRLPKQATVRTMTTVCMHYFVQNAKKKKLFLSNPCRVQDATAAHPWAAAPPPLDPTRATRFAAPEEIVSLLVLPSLSRNRERSSYRGGGRGDCGGQVEEGGRGQKEEQHRSEKNKRQKKVYLHRRPRQSKNSTYTIQYSGAFATSGLAVELRWYTIHLTFPTSQRLHGILHGLYSIT